jgi:hypothetical protein
MVATLVGIGKHSHAWMIVAWCQNAAGSQTVSTVIKALALKQIKRRDLAAVIWKEACAGVLMGALNREQGDEGLLCDWALCIAGALLGAVVLVASFILESLDSEVGAVVAISLPVRVYRFLAFGPCGSMQLVLILGLLAGGFVVVQWPGCIPDAHGRPLQVSRSYLSAMLLSLAEKPTCFPFCTEWIQQLQVCLSWQPLWTAPAW